MNKTWNIVLAMWRPILLSLSAFVVIIGLLFWRLHNLVPGLSEAELATFNDTRSLANILEAGVNTPYNIAVYVVTKLASNTFSLRSVGAAVGVAAILLFFATSRRLYKDSTALASTALFASSSLFLAVSRQATDTVMLFTLLAIISVGIMVRFDKVQAPAWILASIVVALSFYVPGMIVFIVLAAIWQFRHLRKSFEALSPIVIIICSVILSLIIAPLVISLVRDPSLWRAYLGIPSEIPAITEMGRTLLRASASIFAFSPPQPGLWLGRQPILDVFSAALFGYGLLTVGRHYRLERTWTLLGIFIISFAWIAFTAELRYLVVILPFIYIVTGFGMQRLLSQWQSVFPKNPIARSLGAILLGIALVLTANFQLQRYFVAWPNNANTKQTFNLPYPKETR